MKEYPNVKGIFNYERNKEIYINIQKKINKAYEINIYRKSIYVYNVAYKLCLQFRINK